MTVTSKRDARFSREDVRQMMGALQESESVELKLTVPDVGSTVAALAMDPLDAQIREVVFFDTPDLRLNRAGVVARARRVQGKQADSVVKLRPVVPGSIPDPPRRSSAFRVELDATPEGYVCSGSLRSRTDNAVVREVLIGERPIRKLFNKEQRQFFALNAPKGVGLDDLSILGPIFVLKLKWMPETGDRPFVAELWQYPDGSRILELSTKCHPAEAFRVAREVRSFLGGHGVDLTGQQQMKTAKALHFFAKGLRERAKVH